MADVRYAVIKPFSGGDNPYIEIIKKIMNENGYTAIPLSKVICSNYIFKRIHLSHLNWYENVRGKNLLTTHYYILKHKMAVLYLKYIRHSKIIITVHNKHSHDASKKNSSAKLLAWLIKYSDAVIVLCDDTYKYLDNICKSYKVNGCKCFKIPLPSYSDFYKHSNIDEFVNISGKRDKNIFEIAYFGSISEYKNVGKLIELADMIKGKAIHITIAGKSSKDYLDEIKNEVSKRDNISLYSDFIPNDRLWGFIKGADCIVLPYKNDSMLNSASVLLALSVGTNVVCSSNGTINEYPADYTYTYNYADEKDHTAKLYEQIMRAYSDYSTNKELYDLKAETIKNIITSQNSYEVVLDKFNELYKTLER
ncbi:glycosyltransferase [Butyrivibrio sp. INlla16]|uniref:glycosyltransferase n=1 Tax=Butyrivibrio sp. INlla16 TaxID=1520807 RepID=UPI00088CC08E|nr:glycosyltransferase [Butyrivibrio sp. INlla16]SDB09727.1 Glycosyltransferase involved in cell wall bisynthesis [Butyrivibrio sp. INlla16]